MQDNWTLHNLSGYLTYRLQAIDMVYFQFINSLPNGFMIILLAFIGLCKLGWNFTQAFEHRLLVYYRPLLEDRNEISSGTESDLTETEQEPESETDESNQDLIQIKLKYSDESIRLVSAGLREKIIDFKRKHFGTELSANKIVHLIFNGQVLRDESRLNRYYVYNNCVIHCIILDAYTTTTNNNTDNTNNHRDRQNNMPVFIHNAANSTSRDNINEQDNTNEQDNINELVDFSRQVDISQQEIIVFCVVLTILNLYLLDFLFSTLYTFKIFRRFMIDKLMEQQ